MNLTRSSLKNPAAVLVILTLIILFGIISIFKLPIQLTPEIEQPQITTFSGWRQAAPEEIESMFIEPLENAVNHTPGALEVNTNINQGGGAINLTFAVGADMQQAMLDVLTSLNQAPSSFKCDGPCGYCRRKRWSRLRWSNSSKSISCAFKL